MTEIFPFESEQTAEITQALADASKQFGRIEKDARNPHLDTPYSTLQSVLKAVKKPLLDHGVIIKQSPISLPEGWGSSLGLQTKLLHTSGQWLANVVPMIRGEAGRQNPMQVLGSTLSYARRYGLLAILCEASEDDDGATAGTAPAQQERQRKAPPPAQRKPQQKPPPENGQKAKERPKLSPKDQFFGDIERSFTKRQIPEEDWERITQEIVCHIDAWAERTAIISERSHEVTYFEALDVAIETYMGFRTEVGKEIKDLLDGKTKPPDLSAYGIETENV